MDAKEEYGKKWVTEAVEFDILCFELNRMALRSLENKEIKKFGSKKLIKHGKNWI